MVEMKLICEIEGEIHGWDSLWWARVVREDFLGGKTQFVIWLG